VSARDDFEALVWRVAGRRLHPLEVARIVAAAEAYRRTARYREDVKPCGTPAAYMRHLRRREPPCPTCLDARAQQERARRAGEPAA
jgi:hypothetical protein